MTFDDRGASKTIEIGELGGKSSPEPDLPNILTKEDITDVENVNLLNSVSYCTERLHALADMIKEYSERGERLPLRIKELNRNLVQTKQRLELACQQGTIDVQ